MRDEEMAAAETRHMVSTGKISGCNLRVIEGYR